MTAAKIISKMFHPVIVMLISNITINILLNTGFIKALLYTLIFAVSLIPGLMAYVKNKRSGTKPRTRLDLPLLLGGFILTLTVYIHMGAPTQVLDSFIVGVLGGVCIIIINHYWDISLHAAITAGCAALFIPLSLPLTLIFLVISLAVGLARIPIKQHTFIQVVGGWMYGFITTELLRSVIVMM